MMSALFEALYTGKPTDSKALLRLAMAQIEFESVAPQLLLLLKTTNQFQNLPDDVQNQIHRLYQKTTGQSLYIRLHQERVLAALEEHHIKAIPLKGVAFAERFFGHFSNRPTSDIDIFLAPSDLTKTVQCLRKLGFRGPSPFNPLHFHCVMWKRIYPGNGVLHIELHWSLVHENNALAEWDEFWRDATPKTGYRYIRELSVQHTFYCICLHGANHRLDSFKYVLDVAHLIYTRASEIDLHDLLHTCKRDKTLRRVKAVLNIVYANFPSLQQRKPLPYRSRWGREIDRAVLTVPVLTPDSWSLRLRIIKEWFWPLREVAKWHLRNDPGLTSANVYRRFYRQRFVHLLRAVNLMDRTKKENQLHA